MKKTFLSVGIAQLVLRKTSIFQFQREIRYKIAASTQVEIPYYRAIERQSAWVLVQLHKILGEQEINSCVNMLLQLPNKYVLV